MKYALMQHFDDRLDLPEVYRYTNTHHLERFKELFVILFFFLNSPPVGSKVNCICNKHKPKTKQLVRSIT